jgi:hypothetical protein
MGHGKGQRGANKLPGDLHHTPVSVDEAGHFNLALSRHLKAETAYFFEAVTNDTQSLLDVQQVDGVAWRVGPEFMSPAPQVNMKVMRSTLDRVIAVTPDCPFRMALRLFQMGRPSDIITTVEVFDVRVRVFQQPTSGRDLVSASSIH